MGKKGIFKKIAEKIFEAKFFLWKIFFSLFFDFGGRKMGWFCVNPEHFFFDNFLLKFHTIKMNFWHHFRFFRKCKHHENVQTEYFGHLTSFDTHMWYTGWRLWACIGILLLDFFGENFGKFFGKSQIFECIFKLEFWILGC